MATTKLSKKDNLRAIFLVVLFTILSSAGQILLKLGADKFKPSVIGFLSNFILLGGLALYIIGAIILVFALKKADLSLVYPFASLSFIWVFLLSFFFLHETFSIVTLIGMLFVFLGVYFVLRGAENG